MDHLIETIGAVINVIRQNKGLPLLSGIDENTDLREDVGFDSLDLAEFTVRLEEKYSVDIFEDGLVRTLGEVMKKITR